MSRSSITLVKSVSTLTAIASLLLALCPAPAAARKAGGVNAKATSPADDTCSSYAYGLLTNACTTAKSFIMPLTFDSEGYKSVSYVAYGPSATSDVSCKVSSWSSTSGGYTSTATVALASAGSVQTVSLGSLYVWNPGSLYLLCSLAPGAKLHMAQWDE